MKSRQIGFCRKCITREMSTQQGLICNLTKKKPDFEDVCPDFKLDESVKDRDIEGQGEVTLKEIPHEALEGLRLEQNLPLGVTVGLIASIVGAIIWGVITVVTNFQIGYMALAIGALVGFSVRFSGKGIDLIFGISGAILALFGCILGNFLSIIGFLANYHEVGYFEVLGSFDYSLLPEIMSETFQFMDLVFYGIAAYEGYYFSFRKVSEEQVQLLSR